MIQLDQDQQRAVDAAAKAPFAIITGGAGTGKTTIIKELATRLRANNEQVALCAFADGLFYATHCRFTRAAAPLYRIT